MTKTEKVFFAAGMVGAIAAAVLLLAHARYENESQRHYDGVYRSAIACVRAERTGNETSKTVCADFERRSEDASAFYKNMGWIHKP